MNKDNKLCFCDLKKKNERVKEVKEDEDSFFCCVVL
jgi:hypothetical protein